MDMKDIVISKTTYALLKENGRVDSQRFKEGKGPDLYDSWKNCAEECGYDFNRRTPAEEAYKDGWYGQDGQSTP